MCGDGSARGGAGADTLTGGAGDRRLFGDEGDDTLTAREGTGDLCHGGTGTNATVTHCEKTVPR